ncbi:MAG: radical SAM protein [Lachnospiraceae bacterium]|nr:radical SAM protein [Lachnospiraceae bacterium]
MQDRIRRLKLTQMEELAVYRDGLYREPQLRQLFFELTLRCNERCFHCGSRCAADMPDGLRAETYKAILDEVKQNFDISRVQLCITGGEPLLRKDFFDILGYAHEIGYHWGMTSNATLITKETAAKLRAAGMGTISVSIDGLEETHDRLRGMKGGWRRSMEGIRNLIDEHYFHAIQVTTVFNHENLKELDALYDIFKEMDIDSWRVIGLEPIGRALEHPELMLTDEDQRRLFSFIYEQRSEGMNVQYGCSHFLGLGYEKEVRPWYFLCNAGIYTASIMANGDVGACLDIERSPKTVQGNIFENSFTEIWNNRFEMFRRPLSQRCEGCRDCEWERWCAGGAHHSYDYEKEIQRICFKDVLF